VHGYYFELDWGIQHQRVPSLMYIQTYDPYDVQQLASKGYVKVTADTGYHACAFVYDFTKDNGFVFENFNATNKKKYYKIQTDPIYRIYGQDVSFR
jgi:O-glycosyl hydrolase